MHLTSQRDEVGGEVAHGIAEVHASGYAGACLNEPMPSRDVTDPAQVPGWESLPGDLQALFTGVRLPSSFLQRPDGTANFVMGPELSQIDVPPLGRLVRFGRRIGGLGGDFCVDPAAGEVHLVMGDIPPVFVNSSLELMSRTIEIALRSERQFTTGDAEACEAAYESFWSAVQEIDPPALDGYWGDFAADAQAGDYSDNPDFYDTYE